MGYLKGKTGKQKFVKKRKSSLLNEKICEIQPNELIPQNLGRLRR